MVAGARKASVVEAGPAVERPLGRRSFWPRLTLGCAILLAVAMLGVAVGPANGSLDATVRILSFHFPGVGISESVLPAWHNNILGGWLPRVLLAVVALSSLATAITAYLMLKNTTNSLTIMSVVLGGFNTATWVKLAWVLPYTVPAVLVILAHGRILNVLSLDEQQARQVGIDVERTKVVLLGAASLAAAAVVSVSGTIGFVGLIVPHLIRLIWGPDNRALLPLAILLAAAFLIGAHLFARMIDEPSEIPVGIITAFCGVPFFLYLLRRSRTIAL